MGRLLSLKTASFFICLIVVAYLSVIPLSMLLWGSMRQESFGAAYTIQNYVKIFSNPAFYLLLWNSIKFSFLTSLLALCVGTYLAWIVERTDVPFRKTITTVSLIPFVLPGILYAISWILLFSPRIGVINTLLAYFIGRGTAPLNIYSMSGMVWTAAMHLFPVVFLLMSACLRNMDASLEEAAYVSGSGHLQVFRRITCPLMLPAVLGSALVVFLKTIESFDIPALIGVPANIAVLTTKIYLATHAYPAELGMASAYGVILLVGSALCLLAYSAVTHRSERFVVLGSSHRRRIVELGSLKYVIVASAILILIIAVVLPLFVLLWASLVPYYGVPSQQLLAKISLSNYAVLVRESRIMTALGNSLYLAVGSAALIMLLSLLIAWFSARSNYAGGRTLERVAFLPIAIPGVVLGLSLVSFYLMIPLPVYGTVWILLLAYVTKFLPYGVRVISGSMVQINREFEEASFSCGATWAQTIKRITLPLLFPGIMAGWICICILAVREFSTSILLYSPDSIVLSVVAYEMWEGGRLNAVSALSIVVVLVLLTMFIILKKIAVRVGIGA